LRQSLGPTRQFRWILKLLCDADIKVNAEKSTFCTLKIEYLEAFTHKREDKPESNKVQAIIAI
jgi:hypothetical protein